MCQLSEDRNCGSAWVSLQCLIHGLQAKACLLGQVVIRKPQPRPQEGLHLSSRESSPCSGVLLLVLPTRDPKPACPHFATGDSEAQAQRSQRANLSTCDTRSILAWPSQLQGDCPVRVSTGFTDRPSGFQPQAPPTSCVSLSRPPALSMPRSPPLLQNRHSSP